MRYFDPTDARFITSGYLDRSRPGSGVYFDVGGLFGGSSSKKAAKVQAEASVEAAKIQAASADKALALQDKQFNKQLELQEPFRATGVTANNRIAELLGLPGASGSAAGYGSLSKPFSVDQFQADPGYQFRMDEGAKALQNGAASRGGLLSGAAQKALLKYGQDYASNEYGKAYDRYNNNNTLMYNRLAGVSGAGQTASNQLTSAAGNNANAGSTILQTAGNAQANGITDAANARAQGIQAWGNAKGGLVNSGLSLLGSFFL